MLRTIQSILTVCVLSSLIQTPATAQQIDAAGLDADRLQIFGEINTPQALYETQFVPLDLAGFVGGLEPVIAVQVGKVVKAYPVRILAVHGVVNDRLGDANIAVTYCGPCSAATVLKRKIAGQTLNLKSAGALYEGGFLLTDTETGTLWRQRDGKALKGTFNGQSLEILNAQLVSMARFRQDNSSNAGALVLRDSAKSRVPAGKNIALPSIKNPNDDIDDDQLIQEEVRIVGDQAWSLELLAQEKTLKQSDVIILWQPDSSFSKPIGPRP